MNAIFIQPKPSRDFAILLGKKAEVEAGLSRLAKRAARKSLPVLSWTWGKAYSETETGTFEAGRLPPEGAKWVGVGSNGGTTYTWTVHRVPLTLIGETPRYAGWTFAAALAHLGEENIVRALPGVEIPTSYRNRGPVCDHCRHARRRNDTYVLIHEDGRTIQVGSTCIADFLGRDDAGDLAASATFLAEARAWAELGEEGMGGGGSAESILADYLHHVAWFVREAGWVSRTVARERGEDSSATANRAWNTFTNREAARKEGVLPSETDIEISLASALWAETLTDSEVDAAKGDYLHNLRAVARTGLVTHRTAGIAASAVTAYQRALGEIRKRAERAARPESTHVGTVGTRVSFGLAQETAKRTGLPKKGAPLAIDSSPVILDFVTGYETEFGYTTVLKFVTAAGSVLVWKASGSDVLKREDVGKKYTLVGAIKAHGEYKDVKQTVISRCTVTEVS